MFCPEKNLCTCSLRFYSWTCFWIFFCWTLLSHILCLYRNLNVPMKLMKVICCANGESVMLMEDFERYYNDVVSILVITIAVNQISIITKLYLFSFFQHLCPWSIYKKCLFLKIIIIVLGILRIWVRER